jgi:hypothetical protein
LSLPNGTECQAELDQMFSDFQPRCKRSSIRIVGMKMKSRLDELRRAETATTPITVDSSSDSDESSDKDEDNRSVAVATPVEAPTAQSITKVKLCNLDLGHVLVSGFPGDPTLGWEFRFWIPIPRTAGIRNSTSEFGIPELSSGKSNRKT